MNARILVLTALATALAACSSLPDRNSALEQARARVSAAQSDPQVMTLAPEELKHATESLRNAEQAWTAGAKPATVDHLAYMTGQRVTIAKDTASSLASQAITAGAAAERDRMRLALRTAEADAAQQQLATSRESNVQKSAELAAAEANALREKERLGRRDARVEDLESQLKDLNAKKTDRGTVVTLGDVLFDTGQARLLPSGNRNLIRLAEVMKGNPMATAMIEGHTDSVGSANSNYALSQRRANAVKAALVNLGVPANRLSTQAMGPDMPAADNSTASGRQMNRRVEIIFAPQPAATVKP